MSQEQYPSGHFQPLRFFNTSSKRDSLLGFFLGRLGRLSTDILRTCSRFRDCTFLRLNEIVPENRLIGGGAFFWSSFSSIMITPENRLGFLPKGFPSQPLRAHFKLHTLIVSFIVHSNIFLGCQLDKTTTCAFYFVLIVKLYSPSCYSVVCMLTLTFLSVIHQVGVQKGYRIIL